MKNFYVASKFEDQKMVGEVIDILTSLGYKNTYDWRGGEILSTEQAVLDMNGVKDADFVVGIFIENHQYKGAIAEIGMALALNKKVFIIGNWLDKMIFMKLPNVNKVRDLNHIISQLDLYNTVFREGSD